MSSIPSILKSASEAVKRNISALSLSDVDNILTKATWNDNHIYKEKHLHALIYLIRSRYLDPKTYPQPNVEGETLLYSLEERLS